MFRSMTGFGAADGRVGNARVSVEVRTVNHRFFTPSIKLPGVFARWEGDVRDALRRRIARGHVTLFARVEHDAEAGSVVNEPRFATWAEKLRDLRQRYALSGDVDVASVLRMPDVLSTADEAESGSAADLVAIVDRAVDALMMTREQEGKQLAEFVNARMGIIEESLGRIGSRAPERLVAQRDRLRAAVEELAGKVAVDEQRIAQEIAILADRLDVSEELDRFRAHIAEFRKAMSGRGGEPLGKRLGFLLQEMLREANTTGSKANDAAIQHDVITIKEELERIREQVENLE